MADVENGDQTFDTVSLQTEGSRFGDDGESSLGSDSELNGFPGSRETDKYGFIGGAQKYTAESAQDVPPEVLRQRELKWLEMLKDWDKWISKRFKKVRLRCQKGIPPSMRGRAWLYLSGGKVKKERNSATFKELDSREGDPKWVDVIERDLHRQFPFHEMFVSRGGHGQQDLFRVLKAYTLYRPDEGYCQAQAPIAAVLLMHMPAEDAFWGLVQICEKYLPGYYSAGLEAVQLDGEILHSLLKRVCSVAYRHLDKHKIEPVLYMMEWFMCAFSRTLPWASVLRVWDMFLCDGVKIIFRVGLVLLKSMLGSRDKLKACPGQYETMEVLRAIEPRYMQEAYLVHQ
ncbi:TBC1 domain family member 10A-like, partial [Clarias magur]